MKRRWAQGQDGRLRSGVSAGEIEQNKNKNIILSCFEPGNKLSVLALISTLPVRLGEIGYRIFLSLGLGKGLC